MVKTQEGEQSIAERTVDNEFARAAHGAVSVGRLARVRAALITREPRQREQRRVRLRVL